MNDAGLYIHIPFCKSKCPYCNFYSVKYCESDAKNYAEKLISEFKKYKGSKFNTVYLGGGTPSALAPELIEKIIFEIKNNFIIDEKSEITIECNPGKNLENDFKIYKKAGINRISLGMQSAVKEERLALGRIAGKEEIKKAVFDAQNAGISNISLDIMLGTPKQTEEGINETINFIKSLPVTHISAYMLKIEPNTPFFKLQNKLNFPTEDFVCDMYLKIIKDLEAAEFHQYEISNFAKTGFESRHNTKYWQLKPYLGIGATAYSLWNGKRFHYDENFNIIEDGAGATTEEKIMLGLRLKEGINPEIINADWHKFVKSGFMEYKNEKLNFTPKGFLVSKTILSELI